MFLAYCNNYIIKVGDAHLKYLFTQKITYFQIILSLTKTIYEKNP